MAYYYYVSNGEVFEGSTQVTLRGINDQGLQEADGYPTGVLYPVSLINGQNQIIGILLGDNLCLPVGQSADVIGAVVLVLLMDCNSTSGTFLKRQGKLIPMAPVAVQGGDRFYIGEKLNSFEISTGE